MINSLPSITGLPLHYNINYSVYIRLTASTVIAPGGPVDDIKVGRIMPGCKMKELPVD